ncbi:MULTISPECIES: MEDS domain-containing protein [unclassified Paenibacillus]|uniref:MEDS domain-containing protein n=1 Tax=unclassified Paenibacillus TaxID=185978 RepID=UPI001AE89297|nr:MULTISPECIES: MEDS domain-containing protein [unclassified Paenibacillus]MBP1157653.1 putative RNA-binding protein with RPS1 domain [Paenibacillus sp. PvP091]MBP1171610.1 putative RNA-binding protein with RPS1 domain [Paenibacillus sp. PvR098]MBP2437991.1 putative RNA-binding protein with RPS1 domain [Paenibacillus sp. PvP052]
MAITHSISLTQHINVNSGSHVLYFYQARQTYVENAVSFIKAGIDLNQHVIFIDSSERFKLILAKLEEMKLTEHQQKAIHYIDNVEFYRIYEDFHFNRVLHHLSEVVERHLKVNKEVRLWGHVDWREQDNILDKLHTYECECDVTVAGLGFLTVCAYDANTVPAAIQLEMMRSHEYLLTDEEFILSNLYRKCKPSKSGTAFPTLSAQTQFESEIDLYKQKLDFVHVVSHEVRNPLTVIKAYASLVHSRLDHTDDRNKLKAIGDYVDLIDNEISHIIMTEQMLSTESLWRRKLVQPSKLLARY